MKKIVPFKQDLFFKTSVSEITSISLEHTLHKEGDYVVSGDFVISGEYKMTDTSVNTENFSFNLPFDIVLDEKYDTKKMTIDIDDFYYEIVNDNVLTANIEVCIDNLEEKLIVEERHDEVEEKIEVPFKQVEEIVAVNKESDEPVLKLEVSNKESSYTTYHIYIMRDDDTIESVISKYGVNIEDLKVYNDLENIKKGDKIIIPFIKNE